MESGHCTETIFSGDNVYQIKTDIFLKGKLFKYNIKSQKFLQIKDFMPLTFYTATNDFIVGGIDVSTGNPIQNIFKLVNEELIEVGHLPLEIYSASATFYENKLYIAGGRHKSGFNKNLFIFDISKGKTQVIEANFTLGTKIAIFNEKMYTLNLNGVKNLILKQLDLKTLKILKQVSFQYKTHFQFVHCGAELLVVATDKHHNNINCYGSQDLEKSFGRKKYLLENHSNDDLLKQQNLEQQQISLQSEILDHQQIQEAQSSVYKNSQAQNKQIESQYQLNDINTQINRIPIRKQQNFSSIAEQTQISGFWRNYEPPEIAEPHTRLQSSEFFNKRNQNQFHITWGSDRINTTLNKEPTKSFEKRNQSSFEPFGDGKTRFQSQNAHKSTIINKYDYVNPLKGEKKQICSDAQSPGTLIFKVSGIIKGYQTFKMINQSHQTMFYLDGLLYSEWGIIGPV